MAKGRKQVMPDGIGKRFQFLVDGFELRGALCEFLIETYKEIIAKV
jgi:hypothetical protein